MLLRLSPRPVAGPLCVAEMRAELTHDRLSFEPKNVRGVGSRLPMIHETSKDAGSRSVVLSKSTHSVVCRLPVSRCVRSKVWYVIEDVWADGY